jgi:hypothetical protein
MKVGDLVAYYSVALRDFGLPRVSRIGIVIDEDHPGLFKVLWSDAAKAQWEFERDLEALEER